MGQSCPERPWTTVSAAFNLKKRVMFFFDAVTFTLLLVPCMSRCVPASGTSKFKHLTGPLLMQFP